MKAKHMFTAYESHYLKRKFSGHMFAAYESYYLKRKFSGAWGRAWVWARARVLRP